jgi:uncharacterized protein (TIGR00255 family)
MIRSMTGYGSGSGGGYTVEIRSVNHKFLDVSVKMPRAIAALESNIKKAVSDRCSRGRFDVYVNLEAEGRPKRRFSLDSQAAGQYVGLLTELKERFGLAGDIDLRLVSAFKDLIVEEEETPDMDEVWAALQPVLDGCLASLAGMRDREGAVLAGDISARAGVISGKLGAVEARAPQAVSEHAVKLKERIAKLAEGVTLDDDRLQQEIALLADRGDVTEEIVRGRSHLELLNRLLGSDEPAGRKMDFLIQELNREVNTIGSKASDTEIAHLVVDMKAELEKIREQVQNIE